MTFSDAQKREKRSERKRTGEEMERKIKKTIILDIPLVMASRSRNNVELRKRGQGWGIGS